jgi:hypothetical protein
VTRLAGSTPALWPFDVDLDRLSCTEVFKAILNGRRWRRARAGKLGARDHAVTVIIVVDGALAVN